MIVQEVKRQLEALQYKILHNVFCNKVHNAELEALKIAIESMEKQIPKKIKVCKTPNTSFGKARTYYVCPNCGAKMCCDWKFCFECGQALKWGEEDV